MTKSPSFLIVFVLVLISLPALSQSPVCSDLEEGVFYYYSKDTVKGVDGMYIREDNLQKEINALTGDTTLWKVEWTSPCSYTLHYISGGGMEAFSATKGEIKILIQILKTTPAYYTYKAVSKLGKQSGPAISDTLFLVEQLGRSKRRNFVDASFPGGAVGWRDYLSDVIGKNEKRLRSVKQTTTIYIGFVVDTDGTISNVKAIGKKSGALGRVSVEYIKEGPKWLPATVDKKPVKAYRVQPVTFVVE